MTPEDFTLAVLASLADIRTALWSLVAAVGAIPAVVLAHALLTRSQRP